MNAPQNRPRLVSDSLCDMTYVYSRRRVYGTLCSDYCDVYTYYGSSHNKNVTLVFASDPREF